MIGGMGHASMVALGCSIKNREQVFCLDGDGSLLMHLGSTFTIGNFAHKNYKHILFNNNSHESVGGQRTYSEKIDFGKFSKIMGYKKYYSIKKIKDLNSTIEKFLKNSGPTFMEVQIANASMKNLGRPRDIKLIKDKFIYNH